jgi:hypothetical protein
MKTPAQKKFEKNLKHIERLEVERFKVKEKYDEWLEERLELLRSGAFEEKPEGTGYLPEEKKLYKKSEKIRRKLLELNPQKYHYGVMSSNSQLKKRKPVSKGDNGYYACYGCHQLFGYKESEKRLQSLSNKKGGRKKKDEEVQYRGTFLFCKFHEGLKPVGSMQLNVEGLW